MTSLVVLFSYQIKFNILTCKIVTRILPKKLYNDFSTNNFILTALNVLVRRLSFKTQRKIEFLGPFYGLEISPKKTLPFKNFPEKNLLNKN